MKDSSTIIPVLVKCHGLKISLCTLRRFLRRANLFRERKQSPLLDIVILIQHELEGSDYCIGYTAMRQRCIRNGLMTHY